MVLRMTAPASSFLPFLASRKMLNAIVKSREPIIPENPRALSGFVVLLSLSSLMPNNSAVRCGENIAAALSTLQLKATPRPSVFHVDGEMEAMITGSNALIWRILFK